MTKETIGYVVNVFSFVLFFYLAATRDVPYVSPPIKYLAWILLGFGVALIVLSIATFVRNRETSLIEWGIYGIVRHPMYLGAIVLFLSWIFFLPHWTIVMISFVNIAIVYWFILQGERQNLTKFGDTYRHLHGNRAKDKSLSRANQAYAKQVSITRERERCDRSLLPNNSLWHLAKR